jgi:hypothetical protein
MGQVWMVWMAWMEGVHQQQEGALVAMMDMASNHPWQQRQWGKLLLRVATVSFA